MTDIPQLQIHGVDDLRLDRVATPECGADDVVVKVRECGICGTDLGFLKMGSLRGDEPMPIGHELWGEVHEAGSNVTSVRAGDRVVVHPIANGNNIGNGGREGGFTPLLLVRGVAQDNACLLPLADSLPLAYGALVEPLAVGQHAANRVAATDQDKVVIYGAGPIGLSLLTVLSYLGLQDIVVVDLADSRLEQARGMGAIALRADDPELREKLLQAHGSKPWFGMPMPASSVYFEATGVRAVFEGIIDLAGPGSRVCLVGVHKEPATVDLVMLLAKEVSLVPAMGYEHEFDEVIAMLESGAVDPTAMVTHHFPLSAVQDAFATAKDTSRAIKVMVDCQS
ncbi:MAG: alcohol dehydrogenase catalytic domain-containing protein [Halioglobus sp.]|nr:alcohol dehydrogenase catalytic domain-containing protein [Halioglobus sp.]